MGYDHIAKEMKRFTDHSVRCKCGHTMLITTSDGKDICTYCHRYVFASKELEIKYRNKEKFIKLREELNEKRGI